MSLIIKEIQKMKFKIFDIFCRVCHFKPPWKCIFKYSKQSFDFEIGSLSLLIFETTVYPLTISAKTFLVVNILFCRIVVETEKV